MNKKTKRLLILLGILVVCCIAAVAVSQYEEKQEQIATTEDVILAVETGDATMLTWEFEDEDADEDDGEIASGSFSFTRTDGAWIYSEDEAFPTDPDAIEELLEIFTEFTASFIIEEVEDYSQYGLSDPCATITITTADTEYVIELGDFSTMDEQRYVSIGDGNVYLVSTDPMDSYTVELDDLILNDDTPSFDTVSSISIEGEESLSITYDEESEYAYSEDDVYYVETDSGIRALDASSVTSYLSYVTGISLTDYVTYDVTDEDLTELGFDDPELVLTVEYTDIVTDEETGEESEVSGTFVMTVARDADQIAAAEAAEADEESDTDTDDEEETAAAYVRIGESAFVYEINSSYYEQFLSCTYADLCHTEIVPIDTAEITSAVITLDGETYEFTSEIDEEENQLWYYNDEEIEGSTFASKLSALEVSEFTDETASEEEEISITLTFSNENYTSMEIILYRYDGENCLAYVDGEAYAFVSRSDSMDLVEAVNAIVLN